MSSSNHLAFNLKAILLTRHMSPMELAKSAGLSLSTVRQILSMDAGSTLRTLDKISEALSVKPADLIKWNYVIRDQHG